MGECLLFMMLADPDSFFGSSEVEDPPKPPKILKSSDPRLVAAEIPSLKRFVKDIQYPTSPLHLLSFSTYCSGDASLIEGCRDIYFANGQKVVGLELKDGTIESQQIDTPFTRRLQLPKDFKPVGLEDIADTVDIIPPYLNSLSYYNNFGKFMEGKSNDAHTLEMIHLDCFHIDARSIDSSFGPYGCQASKEFMKDYCPPEPTIIYALYLAQLHNCEERSVSLLFDSREGLIHSVRNKRNGVVIG